MFFVPPMFSRKGPKILQTSTDPKVLGWYHRSWDTEPPLQTPPGQERKILERCLGWVKNVC